MGNTGAKIRKRTGKLRPEEIDTPQRTEVCDEILQTEEEYVNSLGVLTSAYLHPLRTSAKSQKKPLLKGTYVKQVFSNVEQLEALHGAFLDRLQEAAAGTQCRELGKIVAKQASAFSAYTVYINNYNDALNALCRAEAKYEPFRMFLEESQARPECRGLSLQAYMIMPVQRIPRYVLLFEALLKHTPEKHPDHKHVVTALAKLRDVAEFINEEKRVAESMQQCRELQRSIVNLTVSKGLPQRHRVFQEEGELLAVDGGKNKELHYFLFNDYLIFAVKNTGLVTSMSNLVGGNSNPRVWKAVDHGLLTGMVLESSASDPAKMTVGTKKKVWWIQFEGQEERDQFMQLLCETRASAPLPSKKKKRR